MEQAAEADVVCVGREGCGGAHPAPRDPVASNELAGGQSAADGEGSAADTQDVGGRFRIRLRRGEIALSGRQEQTRFQLEVDAESAALAKDVATENFDISKTRGPLYQRGTARIETHETGWDGQSCADSLTEVMAKHQIEARAVDSAGSVDRLTATVAAVEHALAQANGYLSNSREGFTEAASTEIKR